MLMKDRKKQKKTKTVLNSVTAMYCHPPHLFNRLVPGNTISYITVYLKCQCHYFICQYVLEA